MSQQGQQEIQPDAPTIVSPSSPFATNPAPSPLADATAADGAPNNDAEAQRSETIASDKTAKTSSEEERTQDGEEQLEEAREGSRHKQPLDTFKTPAPSRSSAAILSAPNAPGPNLALQAPPAQTPASSATPAPGGGSAAGMGVDLAEFDPYATPVPSSSESGQEKEKDASARSKVKVEESHAMTPTSSSQGRARASETAAGKRPEGSVSEVERGAEEEEEAEELKEPQFNFSEFLKDLKMKSADPVARYLKSFLSNFVKKPFTVNEQIKLIHDFLDFISEKMLLVEPWKSQSPAEFDNAMEAMEKLLVASQPITTDDLERDAVFQQRVRLFGWIREKHLDVPEGEAADGFLGFAEQELLKISHYKAPRDKMICVLNCCKGAGLIRNTYGPSSGSADAFIPILIFTLLRANPPNLISNIEYIQRFRRPSALSGEAAYYLSSLNGAVQFVETMDAGSLSGISQEEFEKKVEDAIGELPPSPSDAMGGGSLARGVRTPRRGEDDRKERERAAAGVSPFQTPAPGEEAARPLSMMTAQASLEGTKRWFTKTAGTTAGNLGNLVQEGVSRPLSAIGKILEGMSPAPGSEQRQGQRSEDGSDEESPRRGDRDVFGMRRFRERERAGTPDSPLRFLGVEDVNSRSTTPLSETLPDFSSLQLQASNAQSHSSEMTHRANVQTLGQMFPALDEDVVEAVLDGCGEDLGLAIDRLLEM
ncbi:hypothetical protein I350_01596 [Cryptococcus amylolentus CBS 6273]|uniref:VPS9 domain-containing protein n=1 Tax=Cryptococcus amylolentus CBS 6273 TaxID=1296118 RepID=A0A1E3KDG0_9TREE|nr:hypothetical protein I350_01596 [Cryptococcus amylolentus CBS 6273]